MTLTRTSRTDSDSYDSAAWQDLEDQAISASPPPSGSSGPVMTTLDTYVWGRANVDELVARDDASGNRLYAQQDANGDVTALVGKVSGTWQVVQRFTYSPYGVTTVLSPSWGTTTDAYNWVYGYQGGRYDPITGLYNFRNRDYSPTLGRWMQNDPAGYVNGANLYEANLGAPISHVDPYGLDSGSGSSSGGTGNGTDNVYQPDGTPVSSDFPKQRLLSDPNDVPPQSASSGGLFSSLGTLGSSDNSSPPTPDSNLPPCSAPGSPGSSDDGLNSAGSTNPPNGGSGPSGLGTPPPGFNSWDDYAQWLMNTPPINFDTGPDFGPFNGLANFFQNGINLGANWTFEPYPPSFTYDPGPNGGKLSIGWGPPDGSSQPGGGQPSPIDPAFHISITPP